MGVWDIVLLVAVSTQATVLAYVHSSRGKALLYALPIPFTVASLALGTPIGTSRIVGLLMVFGYAHGVRWLYVKARVPIFAAIAICAVGYCLIGWGLAPVVPNDDRTFWPALAGMLAVSIALYAWVPHKEEPGHRSPLPVAVKFAVIAGVVAALIALKAQLQGFMAVFPMVGVAAAYEARHSLWTLARGIPAFLIAMVPMLAICRLTQGPLGLGPALALGWVAFLAVLAPLNACLWRRVAGRSGEDTAVKCSADAPPRP